MSTAVETSDLGEMCEKYFLLFGDLELELVGRSYWGSIGDEIEQYHCLFAGEARGLKCYFERRISDYVVDSHDYEGSSSNRSQVW